MQNDSQNIVFPAIGFGTQGQIVWEQEGSEFLSPWHKEDRSFWLGMEIYDSAGKKYTVIDAFQLGPQSVFLKLLFFITRNSKCVGLSLKEEEMPNDKELITRLIQSGEISGKVDDFKDAQSVLCL